MKRIDSLYYRNVAEIFKNYFLIDFQTRMINTGRASFSVQDLSPFTLRPSNNYLPLVILVGGVQGSGKSSFIDLCKKHMDGVHELSSIDCVKDLVNYMIKLEESTGTVSTSPLRSHVEPKDDTYRTLLSDLKKIWCDADDGPNHIVCNLVDSLIDAESFTSMMFINVREPEQIDHLKNLLESNSEVVVLTLAVLRNDPTDAMNESDQHTLDYNYDIYIKNSMSLSELEYLATEFCLSVETTNSMVSAIVANQIGS